MPRSSTDLVDQLSPDPNSNEITVGIAIDAAQQVFGNG